jgi:hypothetical protein
MPIHEANDRLGDLDRLLLDGKMSRIEQMQFGSRQVAQIGFGSGSDEGLIEGYFEPTAKKKGRPEGRPSMHCIVGMLGVGGAFVACLVDLPFALAPMSPLLPGLVIGGKLCLGSFEASAAGCLRWS